MISLAGQPLLMQKVRKGLVNEVTSACLRGMYTKSYVGDLFNISYAMLHNHYTIILVHDYKHSCGVKGQAPIVIKKWLHRHISISLSVST